MIKDTRYMFWWLWWWWNIWPYIWWRWWTRERTKCRYEVRGYFWLGLPPSVEESSITGKWHAGIYKTEKCSKLFIGRLLKQFLDEKIENVRAIKTRCLKPKVETGTKPGDNPDYHPAIGMFKVYDVIAGSLKEISLKGKN